MKKTKSITDIEAKDIEMPKLVKTIQYDDDTKLEVFDDGQVFKVSPDWETRFKYTMELGKLLGVQGMKDVQNILREKGYTPEYVAARMDEVFRHVPANPKKRIPLTGVRGESTRKRWSILKRDKFTCQYCGGKAPDVQLHVDHKKPIAAGGDSSDANLITACAGCNMGKGVDLLDG